MFRFRGGRLWFRSMASHKSEELARKEANNRWHSGYIVDIEKRGDLWYVWRR